jgi:hypothetical protein
LFINGVRGSFAGPLVKCTSSQNREPGVPKRAFRVGRDSGGIDPYGFVHGINHFSAYAKPIFIK